MRRLGVLCGMFVVLTMVATLPVIAAATEQEAFYLGPEGIPLGELLLNPRGGELPNYDKGRDVKPGLLLERSELGLAERDETRYQHWQRDAGGDRLTGFATLVIWGAAARFEPDKVGSFDVFLLDCNAEATDCDEIGSGEAIIDSGRGDMWIEAVVDFPEIDHRFADRRFLGVRVVVSANSETDMMFAYGNTAQRSRLTVSPEPPHRPAETAAAAPTTSVAEVVATPVPEVVPAPAPTEEPAVPMASMWPWLVTLVVSTLALIATGAVLMSSLTRPGRHERPLGGEDVAALARSGPRSVRER